MTATTSGQESSTRPRSLRIVKIGSEGIAIKPDTGDLKTDMQTVAMCGLDEKLALMFAAAPEMLDALKDAEEGFFNQWPRLRETRCFNGTPSDDECMCSLHRIQRAIAKAGGL